MARAICGAVAASSVAAATAEGVGEAAAATESAVAGTIVGVVVAFGVTTSGGASSATEAVVSSLSPGDDPVALAGGGKAAEPCCSSLPPVEGTAPSGAAASWTPAAISFVLALSPTSTAVSRATAPARSLPVTGSATFEESGSSGDDSVGGNSVRVSAERAISRTAVAPAVLGVPSEAPASSTGGLEGPGLPWSFATAAVSEVARISSPAALCATRGRGGLVAGESPGAYSGPPLCVAAPCGRC